MGITDIVSKALQQRYHLGLEMNFSIRWSVASLSCAIWWAPYVAERSDFFLNIFIENWDLYNSFIWLSTVAFRTYSPGQDNNNKNQCSTNISCRAFTAFTLQMAGEPAWVDILQIQVLQRGLQWAPPRGRMWISADHIVCRSYSVIYIDRYSTILAGGRWTVCYWGEVPL